VIVTTFYEPKQTHTCHSDSQQLLYGVHVSFRKGAIK